MHTQKKKREEVEQCGAALICGVGIKGVRCLKRCGGLGWHGVGLLSDTLQTLV